MMLLILIVFGLITPWRIWFFFIAQRIFIALSGVSLSFLFRAWSLCFSWLPSQLFFNYFSFLMRMFYLSFVCENHGLCCNKLGLFLSLCIDYFLFNFNLNNHAFKFGISCRSFISTFKACVPVHENWIDAVYEFAFCPNLMDDTTRIMNAQKARGVVLEKEASFKKK